MSRTPPEFSSLLRAKGLKVTPGRLAVLTILQKASKPLTVEELLYRLGDRSADQATVYRMLNIFRDNRIVRQVDFEHGHAHYELMDAREHHHLVCVSCGRVEDVSGCDIEAQYQPVLKAHPTFATIQRHTLELFGLCRSCGKKKM